MYTCDAMVYERHPTDAAERHPGLYTNLCRHWHFYGLGLQEAWKSIQSSIHQYPGAVIGGIQTAFHFFGAKIRNLLELVAARLPQRLAQSHNAVSQEEEETEQGLWQA